MLRLPERVVSLALRHSKKIAGINIAGTLFGYWYYRFQFAETPIYLWMLVSDSPNATLLIAVSLLLYSFGSESEVVDSLAFFGNLKYGLWTAGVLAAFPDAFLGYNSVPMYAFLLFSHLGMGIQAFLVFEYADIGKRGFGVASAWFILNDAVDYSLGIHTSLPSGADVGFARTLAFGLTAVSLVLLYYLGVRGEPRSRIRSQSRP
ncbi:DUF1405 domain-containing protein [Halorutilales archaeon Cl-col2-1]